MPQNQPEGYLAIPRSGKGPGVLVLHAWWGLNQTMRTVCQRLAEQGYVAFAPDLYHGKVVATIEEAEGMVQELNKKSEQAEADVGAAVDFLMEQTGLEHDRIAVVGFSLGAAYALDLSITDPERVSTVVVFYGTGGGDFSRSQATYLAHFAENDPFEPEESVTWLEQALEEAGRPATIYRYPETGHWFFEPDREDAFNQPAAALAWERTLAFLKGSL